MSDFLSVEGVSALVHLAKRNRTPPEGIDAHRVEILKSKGYWFWYKRREGEDDQYLCLICLECIKDASWTNAIVDHGLMHLKEHGLLAFL